MLFARFDWFLHLGISSAIHLLAASGEKKIRKWNNYLGIAIKLVLYILKQLFASVLVNSGGYLPRRSSSGNIHRYSPPLRRMIVKHNSSRERYFPLTFQLLTLWTSPKMRPWKRWFCSPSVLTGIPATTGISASRFPPAMTRCVKYGHEDGNPGGGFAGGRLEQWSDNRQ